MAYIILKKKKKQLRWNRLFLLILSELTSSLCLHHALRFPILCSSLPCTLACNQYGTKLNPKFDKTQYEETRDLMRRGKLASKNSTGRGGGTSTQQYAQIGIVAAFLAAFMATPFVGRRIAQDEEFRKRWIPSWYDYTVKKPDVSTV